jgi:hypothetical protein
MSLNIEKDSGILESSLPVDDTKGEVDHDRNDRPLSTPSPHPPSSNSKSSASPLVQSAPHFVARATSGQRTESSGPFTSSAQPTSTTLRAGAPRHGHGHENGERGFLEGTPQAIARQDYVGADKKKEPEYASPFEKREAREARYPLSSATNGSAAHKSTTAPEPKRFYDSVPYWLALYFCFNLGLTLFNKIVLVSFPFPYTLTGLHALSGCAGTYIALERGAFVSTADEYAIDGC